MSGKKKLGKPYSSDYNKEMAVNTYIQLVHIKVNEIAEAEKFFDIVFDILGLENKEKTEERITYWGAIGIMLHQQNEVLADIDHFFRLGMVQLGIRVGNKALVDQLYQVLNTAHYTFDWEPRSFDYSKNYYSFLVFDPDDNKFEFIFDG